MKFALIALSLTAATLMAQPNVRYHNQQARIAQGVRSGQLNSPETARLERRETAIKREVRTERALNGGHLTPGERAVVNHQQNRLSRQIYRAKHN